MASFASPPPMHFQLQPVSGETSSPSETPARSESFFVRPRGGSARLLGPTPSASSQRNCQVAPWSWDGRMPYVALRTTRSGFVGEKTI